MPNNETHHVQP